VGWYFFGHSMSLKSFTLVSVTSSSGQPERVSWGRRGAAQLGMPTFTIGIVTQQWHVALMGIVYSYVEQLPSPAKKPNSSSMHHSTFALGTIPCS